MMIGNASYESPRDIAEIIPIFPLRGALLLPRGELPLTIFEDRYVAMLDDVLASDRLIGMIQPDIKATDEDLNDDTPLCPIGCIGRVTGFHEVGDGRYEIALTGICRFLPLKEIFSGTPYRTFRVDCEHSGIDFSADQSEERVDRKTLIETLGTYLQANNLEADWERISEASNEILVNALSMMSPFDPAEKQALLVSEDIHERSEMLIALTEMHLAREGATPAPSLQ